MDDKHIFVTYESGMDTKDVLQAIAGTIVNGRIRFDGAEQREDDVYWTKAAGGYKLAVAMPFCDDGLLTFDVDRYSALKIEVKKGDD